MDPAKSHEPQPVGWGRALLAVGGSSAGEVPALPFPRIIPWQNVPVEEDRLSTPDRSLEARERPRATAEDSPEGRYIGSMDGYISGRPAPRWGEVLAGRPRRQKVFPLDQARCYGFFSGRYALAVSLKALGIIPGDRVLVPAYNCGVELDPFLHHGIRLEFYRVGRDFLVDLDDLLRRSKGGVKGVLVTHYLGFPQPIEAIVDLCRERGILCIEDCAHAFLSSCGDRPLGSYGDAAVFSLLKTLPVATGGLLVLNGPNDVPLSKAKAPRAFPVWFHLAELTARRSYQGRSPRSPVRLGSLCAWGLLNVVKTGIAATRKVLGRGADLLVRPDGFAFEPRLRDRGMSRACQRIVSRTDLQAVREARRRNYEWLSGALRDLSGIHLPFERLADGVCPLFFPLLVRSREIRQGLYQRLRERGVVTHPWWDRFRSEVPWARFPEAVYLKEHLLGLPIHQDLTVRDMGRVIEEFEAVYREVASGSCRA